MQEVVYEVVCPHCGKKNKVIALQNDAFNEREEIWYAEGDLKVEHINQINSGLKK